MSSNLAAVPRVVRQSEDVVLPCARVNPSPTCLVTSSSSSLPPPRDSPELPQCSPPRTPLPRTKKYKRNCEKDDFDQDCFLRKREMPPEATSIKARHRVTSPLSHVSSRRSNKPQMEKKRRQREKESLTKIRECILTVFKVAPSKYLDKAEILEKTVKLLNYIMARHYSSDPNIANKDSKSYSAFVDHINNEKNAFNNSGEIDKGKDTPDLIHDIVNLNCQPNQRRPVTNRVPNRQEPVVALYIPQVSTNHSINQKPTAKILPNHITSDLSATATPPVMQFVVNNNYYMKSSQVTSFGQPSSPESSSSCEVSSSDSSFSENFGEDSFQDNFILQKNTSEEIFGDSSSIQKKFSSEISDNFNIMRKSMTPEKVSTLQLQKQQIPFGQRLIAPKPSISNANLHRPWEK